MENNMTYTRFGPWTFRDDASCDAENSSNDCRAAREWTPAVDILEEDDSFIVRADVPGVEPSDIDVSLDNDILSISGQRGTAAGSNDVARQRVERSSGRFSRRFRMPDTVDANGITARCNIGILEVVIPKAPDVPARRITVKAA
jgi:HSP20 family protein